METYREFISPRFGVICVDRRPSGETRVNVYVEDGRGESVQIASSSGIYYMPTLRDAFAAVRRDLS